MYEVFYGTKYSKFFNNIDDAMEFYKLKGNAIYRIIDISKRATKNNREKINS